MAASRRLILTAVLCAMLAATGTADARGSKKKKHLTQPPSTGATMPGHGAGATGQGHGMGPYGPGTPAMPGQPGQPGAGHGEFLILRNFDAIDTDHSGALSRAEITAWVEQAHAQAQQVLHDRFRAADTNADGLLSRDEARIGAPLLYEQFEFMDVNGDGQVSMAELGQLRDLDLYRNRVVECLRRADFNHDGKLDLAEAQVALPGLAVRFTLLDQDGDGYLTLDEIARRFGGI
jgi:Ca2+-binding EF-hand superfamily protein